MLDRIDRRILSTLQENCRQSMAELAETVSLSPSACHRRVGLLESAGLIDGYVAALNQKALGYGIAFFAELTLNAQSEDALEDFERAVTRIPEVVECHLMAGQADYLVKVVAVDTADYERIHRHYLSRLPHVTRIHSSLVLRPVKRWAGIPVPSS